MILGNLWYLGYDIIPCIIANRCPRVCDVCSGFTQPKRTPTATNKHRRFQFPSMEAIRCDTTKEALRTRRNLRAGCPQDSHYAARKPSTIQKHRVRLPAQIRCSEILTVQNFVSQMLLYSLHFSTWFDSACGRPSSPWARGPGHWADVGTVLFAQAPVAHVFCPGPIPWT